MHEQITSYQINKLHVLSTKKPHKHELDPKSVTTCVQIRKKNPKYNS